MSFVNIAEESRARVQPISLLSVDNGRFLAPVRAGDTIRTEVEVVSRRETRDMSRGVVVFRDHVLNQRNEVVFEIDKTTLIKRRPAA